MQLRDGLSSVRATGPCQRCYRPRRREVTHLDSSDCARLLRMISMKRSRPPRVGEAEHMHARRSFWGGAPPIYHATDRRGVRMFVVKSGLIVLFILFCERGRANVEPTLVSLG